MSHVSRFASRQAAAAAVAFAVALAGCGGGGEVFVVAQPPPVAVLGIALTRIGPQTVQVDWSNDPYADFFTVSRDARVLANARSLTLVDSSVFYNQSHCYAVTGYDRAGHVISASDIACITIFP